MEGIASASSNLTRSRLSEIEKFRDTGRLRWKSDDYPMVANFGIQVGYTDKLRLQKEQNEELPDKPNAEHFSLLCFIFINLSRRTTRLTRSPYTTEMVSVRCYTMLSMLFFKSQDVQYYMQYVRTLTANYK